MIGEGWATDIRLAADGAIELLAADFEGGFRRFESVDGLAWRDVEVPFASLPVPWGGGEVARSQQGPAGVLLSNGESWWPVDLVQVLSAEGTYSFVASVAGGDEGLVALVGSSPFDASNDGRVSTSLIKDGFTITVVRSSSEERLTVARAGEQMVDIDLWSGHDPVGVSVDFFASEATFHDPETNQDLVTLTFDELKALDQGALSQPSMRMGVHFSSDGEEWIQRGVVTDGGFTDVSPPILVAGGWAFAAVPHGDVASTRVLAADVSDLGG